MPATTGDYHIPVDPKLIQIPLPPPHMGAPAMTTSTSGNKDTGEQFVRAAVPLMKEYTEKLLELVREADEIRQSWSVVTSKGALEAENARAMLARIYSITEGLSSPVGDLIRRVSQMIEHGQLDSELDRVELKLRLAELENALSAARWKSKQDMPPSDD